MNVLRNQTLSRLSVNYCNFIIYQPLKINIVSELLLRLRLLLNNSSLCGFLLSNILNNMAWCEYLYFQMLSPESSFLCSDSNMISPKVSVPVQGPTHLTLYRRQIVLLGRTIASTVELRMIGHLYEGLVYVSDS